MINSLTQHIGTKGTDTERSPLIDQIARRADVNRDGNVTSAEFSSFLSGLMESLDQATKATTTVEPSATPQTAVAPLGPERLAQTPQDVVARLRQAIASVSKER